MLTGGGRRRERALGEGGPAGIRAWRGRGGTCVWSRASPFGLKLEGEASKGSPGPVIKALETNLCSP